MGAASAKSGVISKRDRQRDRVVILRSPMSADADIPTIESLQELVAGLRTLVLAQHGRVEVLQEQLAERDAKILELTKELAQLKRGVTERSSERQTRPPSPPLTPDQRDKNEQRRLKTRKKRRIERNEALGEPERVEHAAPATCPRCGNAGGEMLPAEEADELELVPARIVRRRHCRQKLLCTCGQIRTAPPVERPLEGSLHGPQLMGELVVSKVEDASPINRQCVRLGRARYRMSRQTATDLFHGVAAALTLIYLRMLELVAAASHVNADETSQPVRFPGECRNGFVWTFISTRVVAFVFAMTRAGEVASEVLGNSTGTLQCDGHTGYNRVTDPARRKRIGCLAHLRRYFVLALASSNESAMFAIRILAEVFAVERQAAELEITGTAAHVALRETVARPALDRLKEWIERERPKTLPKSPLGEAFTYATNQWERLTAYLPDPNIEPHNNIAERTLRVVARGRDNFRWVGNEGAGRSLAILLTIVQTCRANGVEPTAYIADVLMRVGKTSQKDIDTLLPWNWKAARDAEDARNAA